MKNNQDKSAFPSDATDFEGREYGLTKREYFAAMAMQGFLSAESEIVVIEDVCANSVRVADALLEELAK